MVITRKYVADQISQHLHHKIGLEELVDWAENAMQEGEFEEEHSDEITEVVAGLDVADVKIFGLMWEDCEALLNKLGYKVYLDIKSA